MPTPAVRHLRLLGAGALVVGAVVAFAAPANAGNRSRPDLKISASKTGPFLKNDVYNLTAEQQTVKKTTAAPGSTKRYFLKVQDDRTSGGLNDIHVESPPAFGCFNVKFFGAGTGFDSDEDYTYLFAGTAINFQPGETKKWRVEVTGQGCAPGAVQGTVISGESIDGTRTDAVKVKLKVV